jgi:hypothetical protein
VSQVIYRKFDIAWNFPATLSKDGNILSSDSSSIQSAQLILIRQLVREQIIVQREILTVLKRMDRRAARRKRT